jgi:polyhydroxyalkanoate synthase
MKKRGYLEGSEMATTFNMLRANDLIWSFVVNNYLLGKDPFPFDLLYWNSDSTRMPAKMHSTYLRTMYLENRFCRPGGVTLGGVPIDLATIETPSCFVSTLDDHIAPWKATYAGAQLFAGPVKFILGKSGHIAGIINPPAANKYGYFIDGDINVPADQWFARACSYDGSWWSEWARWVEPFCGPRVAARTPAGGKLPVIEPAPGSYVRVRA